MKSSEPSAHVEHRGRAVRPNPETYPGLTCLEAVRQAQNELETTLRKRPCTTMERLALWWSLGDLEQADTGYRTLMLQDDAVYHGDRRFGSPWRALIDATCGRFGKDVRR